MRNLLLVARREYLEQIRGRAFRVSTILVPLVFGLVIFIAYLAGRGSGVGKHVIVAAPRAALGEAIRAQVMSNKDAKTIVDVVAPASPADRASLVSRVESKQVDGLLWVTTGADGSVSATYTSQSSGDIVVTGRLESALNHALAMERMTARGMSTTEANALLKNVSVDTLQVGKEAPRSKAAASVLT